MAAIISIAVLVLLAGLLGFAATRPDTFRVQRSASIKAPPQKISALIDDFHNWSAWSPWEKLDPALQRTYSGPARGKGAVYAWEGNRKVGQGRMEILETSPSRTTIQLDFLKPFEAHNTAEFTLEPGGDSTNVIWAMHGKNAFIAKLMGVFLNMDRLIGKDFESGLANLKVAAEK
jgi:carbon monoxide dehydrogenase subunit G